MVMDFTSISGLSLLLLVASIPQVNGCYSTQNDEVSYNATLKWHCAKEEPQRVYCDGINDAFVFITANITGSCIKPSIKVSLLSLYDTLDGYSTFELNDGYFGLFGTDNGTLVHCKEKSMLKFEANLSQVDIYRMSFENCSDELTFLLFSGYYKALTLYRLTMTNFIGSGVTFENIAGSIRVNESTFINGLNSNTGIIGSSIVINVTSNQPSQYHSKLMFIKCIISGYKAIQRSTLGGGGLTAKLGGYTANFGITVISSHIQNNIAEWGAGLHVEFFDNATNNSLFVSQTVFKNNSYVSMKIKPDLHNVGGGASIITSGGSASNTIIFENCSFVNNTATWGGGLAIHAKPNTRQSVNKTSYNTYVISSCNFSENITLVGSAVSLYCSPPPMSPQMCNAIPNFEGSSNFTRNGQRPTVGEYSSTTESMLQINAFPTYIKGATLNFEENNGSALYVRNSALALMSQTKLRFSHNTAETGAGIALYDSWMTVSSGCNLSFIANTAFVYGGAIYALQSTNLYVPHIHSCFIRSTSQTGSNFHFAGNKAKNKPNVIYATSIIPCINDSQDIMETFCGWENWSFNYTENCIDEIQTSVSSLNGTPESVMVFPGVPKPFVVGTDDLGHVVSKLYIVPTLWPRKKDIVLNYTDNGLIVYANRNTSFTLLLQVDDAQKVMKTVDVSVGNCPPGFGYKTDEHMCTCLENIRNVLKCQCQNTTVSIMNGYCMSFSLISGMHQTVYGRCVFTSAWKSAYIDLPTNEVDLDRQFCGKFNRTGLLCGRCNTRAAIDVFSPVYSCHSNCHSSAWSWVIFAAVNCIPPLLLFLIILTVHVKFTGASTNGFIFFSHVLTLSQEALVIATITHTNTSPLSNYWIHFIWNMYSLWSLDNNRIFHTLSNSPVCLGEHLRVIDVLVLHYLSALYPFLLIVVAYIIIELHARNCRLLVWLWKPLCFPCTRLRRSWKLQASVVDAFASFIILSYVKLVRISLLILTFTTVRKIDEEEPRTVLHVNNFDPSIVYLSHQHIPFVLLGILVFLTFTIFPPLLLIFYQCRLVQRCLNHCNINRVELKSFVEVFQGCYKDGRNGGPDRRFFAGLYLIFRVAIFVVFNLEFHHVATYYNLVVVCIVIICLIAWLQPYKVHFYNCFDTCFAALLGILFGLHILGFVYLETLTHIPTWIMRSGVLVFSLPLVYIIGLFMKNALCCCRQFQCMKSLLKFRMPQLSRYHPYVLRNNYSAIPHVTHSEVFVDPSDSTSRGEDEVLSNPVCVDNDKFENEN